MGTAGATTSFPTLECRARLGGSTDAPCLSAPDSDVELIRLLVPMVRFANRLPTEPPGTCVTGRHELDSKLDPGCSGRTRGQCTDPPTRPASGLGPGGLTPLAVRVPPPAPALSRSSRPSGADSKLTPCPTTPAGRLQLLIGRRGTGLR